MKKTVILLSAILFVTSLSAQIQIPENVPEKLPHQTKRFTVATQPLYIFNNAIRLDFEMRIKNTPSWIQISPVGYLLPALNEDNTEYWTFSGEELSSLRGGGLELNYKYFFNKKESFYVAAGGSYTHYNIGYSDYYMDKYIEDGLVYYMYKYGDMKQQINKWGLNTYIGYQIPTPTFLFDMFVGLGYRYSHKNNDVGNQFDGSMISFGYTGAVFLTGVRFGVKLK
jgi:hypothetical protein